VALCLVIGANLGSGLLAMLNNSAANASRAAWRSAVLFKLVGSLIILPFVHPLADAMHVCRCGIGTGYLLPRLLQPDALHRDGAFAGPWRTLQADDSR
jgi:hypothetical protein